MSVVKKVLLLLTTLQLVQQGSAQVGVTICACQPDFYEFTLNFSLVCADMDVTPEQPGILDTACQVDTPGRDNVTDFKPATISKVQVVELDQNFQVIFQANYDMVFIDGQTFNYSSITKTMPMLLNDTSVPSAIQLSIFGRNAAEEDLLNFWSIEYNNSCGIWPLLYEGQRAGWTIFSDLGTPSSFICPAVPTEAPVFIPSDAPTKLPTFGPPSGEPTFSPSVSPVTSPPAMGTPFPTAYPTVSPTTCPPTRPPVESSRRLSREEKDRLLMVGVMCVPTPEPTYSPTSCPPSWRSGRRLAGGRVRGSEEYRKLMTGHSCVEPIGADGGGGGGGYDGGTPSAPISKKVKVGGMMKMTKSKAKKGAKMMKSKSSRL